METEGGRMRGRPRRVNSKNHRPGGEPMSRNEIGLAGTERLNARLRQLEAMDEEGRVYTAGGKPRRVLGSVESDPYDTPAVTRVPKGKFTIIPEPVS